LTQPQVDAIPATSVVRLGVAPRYLTVSWEAQARRTVTGGRTETCFPATSKQDGRPGNCAPVGGV